MRLGAQARGSGFELPANLALIVEPYGPRNAATAGPAASPAAGSTEPLTVGVAVHDACLVVVARSAAGTPGAAEEEDEEAEDGGAAWLAENPDGPRDPRDSGEEEDDPAGWLCAAQAPSSARPQLGAWSSLLELVASADAAPVEASADPAAADPAAADVAWSAWVGPKAAWPAAGDDDAAACGAKLARPPLAVLDLARCSLRGALWRAPLSHLGNALTALILDGNALDGPLGGACAAQLVQLTGLETLSLAQNQLSGPLPAELGRLHRSLRVLKLGGNRLMGPIPAAWVYFETKLEELSLGDNAGVNAQRDGWLADRLPLCLVHL